MFKTIPTYPDEQDGFTNHEARLTADYPIPDGLPELKQVFNRTIVIAPDIESVKPLQQLLPEFFHTLEPISLIEAINLDLRPEPGRLLQATREQMNEFRDTKRGKVFFLAYSIFEWIEGYGGWVDLRDHHGDCKWGRRPVTHAPGCTRSFQILQGETTIAQVKADCGFK